MHSGLAGASMKTQSSHPGTWKLSPGVPGAVLSNPAQQPRRPHRRRETRASAAPLPLVTLWSPARPPPAPLGKSGRTKGCSLPDPAGQRDVGPPCHVAGVAASSHNQGYGFDPLLGRMQEATDDVSLSLSLSNQ